MRRINKIIQPFKVYNEEIYQLLEKNKNKLHVGEEHTNTQGYIFVIVDYEDCNHMTNIFLDEYHYKTIATYDNIKKGKVRNPYGLNSHGGRVGAKYKYTAENELIRKIYIVWSSMLQRTDPQYISSHDTHTAYLNTTVCDQWYFMENFCDWYLNEYNQLNPNVKYHIDKDVLQWNMEKKVYSPETCILLPEEINMTLTGSEPSPTAGVNVTGCPGKYAACLGVNNTLIYLGTYNSIEEAHLVYAKAKYDYVVELADKYYAIGALTDKAYQALLQLDFR